MQETQVQSLGREAPLEEGMATHSSIHSCLQNPMDRGAWRAAVHRVAQSQITTEATKQQQHIHFFFTFQTNQLTKLQFI